jgi:non-canonical purine NTP pyrophosphatase (RdgB/HAM1 family)
MSNVTFITGNLVGRHIKHQPADVAEIQSLDLAEIVEYKARAAYEQLKTPVIIEDTGLVINSLGKMPGPFIKWFEKELGLEKICRLADLSSDRSASAGAAFAYFDGQLLKIFKSKLSGTISDHPKGDEGYGWNPIFIPEGASKTLGEMDDIEFKQFYVQIKPFNSVKEFLTTLDKN